MVFAVWSMDMDGNQTRESEWGSEVLATMAAEALCGAPGMRWVAVLKVPESGGPECVWREGA